MAPDRGVLGQGTFLTHRAEAEAFPAMRSRNRGSAQTPQQLSLFWDRPRKDGGQGLLYHKLKRTLATASFFENQTKATRCNRDNSLEEELKALFKEKSASYNSLSTCTNSDETSILLLFFNTFECLRSVLITPTKALLPITAFIEPAWKC